MQECSAEIANAADRSGNPELHASTALQGACRLQVLQHRAAGSSGDGSNEIATPSSMASGGSTPGKLKRAFLAAVNGNKSAVATSSDAWDQIVNSSRKQHKRICYLLLAAIVIIAAVGAGGIAAGAKAKTAHERWVAAAAAAKAAERAAQAAAPQQADSTTPDVKSGPKTLGYEVMLSVFTAEAQQQACSNWFGSEERTSQYEKLFTSAYSQALDVQQSDMTVDNIQCGGSKVTMSNSGSSSSNRSLKQVTNPVEVITVFSLRLPAASADSTRITDSVITRSGGILNGPLSGFFAASTLVTKAGQIGGTNSTTPSSTASTAVQGLPAPKPQVPSASPADQTFRSGSAATDIIKAGGIAAEAVGAAPVTPSQAASAANRGSAVGPTPLVVVDHDGTVTINAPDEVLMPESAAVNSTQMQEFRDAMKRAGRAGGKAKQGESTVQIQLPAELAVQDTSNIPENVIPVTQASFTATEPPVLAPSLPAAQSTDSTNVNTSSNSSNSTTTTTSSSNSSTPSPAAPPAVAPAAAAAAEAAVTPAVHSVEAAPATAPVTETSGSTASGTSILESSNLTANLQPNPSAPASAAAPAANDATAVSEDTSSNPATTTFFPEAGYEVPEAAQTPEPTQVPTGSPTAAQVAAFNWESVQLDSFDKTQVCPFMPVEGNFMGDALGRLWSLSNGQACAFKAPNPAQLSADPSGTKGAPLPTWDTAADCGGVPNSSNSLTDAGGHTWGWRNGVSCAFKSQPAQASGNSSNSGGPKMDTVWEVAPVCSAAPIKFTSVPDVFGRLWGVEGDGRSCAYKYTGNQSGS